MEGKPYNGRGHQKGGAETGTQPKPAPGRQKKGENTDNTGGPPSGRTNTPQPGFQHGLTAPHHGHGMKNDLQVERPKQKTGNAPAPGGRGRGGTTAENHHKYHDRQGAGWHSRSLLRKHNQQFSLFAGRGRNKDEKGAEWKPFYSEAAAEHWVKRLRANRRQDESLIEALSQVSRTTFATRAVFSPRE